MVDVAHIERNLVGHYLLYVRLVGVGSFAEDAVLVDVLYRAQSVMPGRTLNTRFCSGV